MKRQLILALAGLASGLAAQKSATTTEKPNVVFILADDLGYGDLGCYGQRKIHTPRLDRMAAEGVRFTNFYAGSTVCAPSRCVLMTGKHTGHCRVRGNKRIPLRAADVTVAESLHDHGYRTALFGKWGLGNEGTTGVPTRQGFDEFFGYLDQAHAHNYYPSYLIRGEQRVRLDNVVPKEGRNGQGVATKKVTYSHDLFADEALAFLKRNEQRPFFLYLALTIPHANNEARRKGMEVPDHGRYTDLDWPTPQKGHAAMITRMDRDVGRILDALDELGIADRTLVMFTSDNGPHREGGNNPKFADSNGPLRGIKRDLYEGGIRVPFLARWKGKIEPGVCDRVAYFGDVFATVAEATGSKPPEEHDGLSFFGDMTGKPNPRQHEFLYWEFYEGGSAQAVRAGRWKAVRKPMLRGRIELYDLSVDIGERKNIASEHADIVAKMQSYMAAAHTPSKEFKVRRRKR